MLAGAVRLGLTAVEVEDDALSATKIELVSTITCPACAARTTETMPLDACLYFYDCPACGAKLKPKPGDCCVFCSYGDVACPPVQGCENGDCGT
jgi:hypothetical protein